MVGGGLALHEVCTGRIFWPPTCCLETVGLRFVPDHGNGSVARGGKMFFMPGNLTQSTMASTEVGASHRPPPKPEVAQYLRSFSFGPS